jgi:hypothetical protein
MPITGLTIVGTGPHIGALINLPCPNWKEALRFLRTGGNHTERRGYGLQRLAGSGWIPIWDNPWNCVVGHVAVRTAQQVGGVECRRWHVWCSTG